MLLCSLISCVCKNSWDIWLLIGSPQIMTICSPAIWSCWMIGNYKVSLRFWLSQNLHGYVIWQPVCPYDQFQHLWSNDHGLQFSLLVFPESQWRSWQRKLQVVRVNFSYLSTLLQSLYSILMSHWPFMHLLHLSTPSLACTVPLHALFTYPNPCHIPFPCLPHTSV